MAKDNKLLLVEDEELINALEIYLSRAGYEVIKEKSGKGALSALERYSPSLVLTKIDLEDMNGLELLKKGRREYPDTEFIMMLDEDHKDLTLECLRSDASDIISKPINSEALEIALQRATSRRDMKLRLKQNSDELETAQRNKVLFQQLFDAVPCYISLQDKNFRLTGTNEQFKRDFGDHIGSYCYEIYKHRTEPCRECPVKSTFQDGEHHQTEEVVTSKRGEQYYVMTWTAPIYDDQGNINQVMEMSTNITQIRKLQSHLTSLGLLIGSMSHGIRGMLTGLDGGIYRLESGLEKNDHEKVQDALEVVKNLVDRIQSMVLDILYYTKERSLNVSRINAVDFSAGVANLIRPRAEKHGINFKYEVETLNGFFEADPESVSSAIVNVLENSIDACLDDRSDEKTYEIKFTIKDDKEYVIFDIQDNGAGMDRETQGNLFTLFFSSKGNRGTGLGLFIANQIVEQHCGNIKVDSSVGKGSHFSIKLPRILPESAKLPKENGENIGSIEND